MATLRPLMEKYYKDKYLEAAKENSRPDAYTFKQLQALRDMAERDVYPDGRFSDEACNVWSMFHSFHIK